MEPHTIQSLSLRVGVRELFEAMAACMEQLELQIGSCILHGAGAKAGGQILGAFAHLRKAEVLPTQRNKVVDVISHNPTLDEV
jgi:hypothetical protein